MLRDGRTENLLLDADNGDNETRTDSMRQSTIVSLMFPVGARPANGKSETKSSIQKRDAISGSNAFPIPTKNPDRR